MPRSEHLADMSTEGLREQRDACLRLIDVRYDRCSESVTEYHADYADRISDELDRRNNAQPTPNRTNPLTEEPMDTTHAAVFTAAAHTTTWKSTNIGPTTEISHNGYKWTIDLPAEGHGPARITGRHGYGGTEILDICATPEQTAPIVEAAVDALRPAAAARPAHRRQRWDATCPVYRLQRWDAFDEVWVDRGTFTGERGQLNADFAVGSERASDTGPLRMFKDGEVVFADDPATYGLDG